MTNEAHNPPPGLQHDHFDLEPWIILLGNAPQASVALWQIDQQSVLSMAMFSDRAKAVDYAVQHCTAPYRVEQLDQHRLIRVLAECYRQNVRYATLNPTDLSARQVFILRDVLKSARTWLQRQRQDSL